MIVGRDALQQPALRTQIVPVPELGGDIILRELSAADVHRLAAAGRDLAADDALANLHTTAFLLSLCWVDENGQRVMTGEHDIETVLNAWPLELLNRLGQAASVATGLTSTAKDDAKKK